MKTIEEAARDKAGSKTNDYGTTYDESDIELFKAGVEFAQKWIPVKEDLPNSDVPGSATSEIVLAKSEELANEVTAYSHLVNKTWHIYPSGKIITITHWRPIECN